MIIESLMVFSRKVFQALGRKKNIYYEEGVLSRCLSALDLTALGVGSTLGVGVYVLAGQVAKNVAGPAVIFSFLIAAVASLFAGLCYAEFGARVPRAGSAYAYSYVCVGEFIAFLMGWNLILEYVIGTASVVKSFSSYLDQLLGKTMERTFTRWFPISIPNFSKYPDFFSFGITLLFSLALAVGVKESSLVNNCFTIINMSVVAFVIISGSIVIINKTGFKNWNIPSSQVPEKYGTGGFFPYGIEGVLKGAAKCFYGFIGFDCIATAGEEAKDPQKTIPLATVLSLIIILLTYFGTSSVLTLMVPYYNLDMAAPLARVFDDIGWHIIKNAIVFGALFALCASLFGALFPLPRIIFAMSQDGLLFKVMGKVHKKFQTPFAGTLMAGFFTGFMSCVFELEQLFSMMSIGTLMAYSMVAICVLILRYECKKNEEYCLVTFSGLLKQCITPHLKNSTKLSSILVTFLVILHCFLCLLLALCLKQFLYDSNSNHSSLIVITCILIILCFITLFSISRQPTSGKSLTFMVPFVPWIPGISILINIYLMLLLETLTWIQFGIWISIGLIIYFTYSIRHSNERFKNTNNSVSLDTLETVPDTNHH